MKKSSLFRTGFFIGVVFLLVLFFIPTGITGENDSVIIYPKLFPALSQPYEYFVINEKTVRYCINADNYDYVKKHFPLVNKDFWNNFVKINQIEIPVKMNEGQNFKYKVLSQKEVENISSDENPVDVFNQLFPNGDGIWYLSRISYNQNSSLALVLGGSSSIDPNELRGRFSLFLLKKISSFWIIVGRFTLCVS